jgi:hypothetical protein
MRLLDTRIFLLILLGFTATVAEAASLYIDPPFSELNRGDAVELSIRLDVDEATGECVNAVDGVISYSESIEPVDISIGDSIFSIWVEQPVINKESRTISFAGGMPNGYCGRVSGDPRLTNRLVNIIFRSPGFTIGGGGIDDSSATVSFTEQTTAYLNDGFGTPVVPRIFGAELTLNRTVGPGVVDPWREAVNADNIPPEEFSIFLSRDDLAFTNKYYIAFNTTDKQTGIDEYQVMEEPLEQLGSFGWGAADAPWITTRSPYVLKDQTLNSVIRVKAIDKAGNEYIATLIPEESMRTKQQNRMLTIVIFVVIGLIAVGCVGVIATFVVQRRKRNKQESEEELEPTEPDDNQEADVEPSETYDEDS